MAKKLKTRRRKVSYLSTVISISLVLYLLGLFSVFVLYATELRDNTLENFSMRVTFLDNAREADIMRSKSMLEEKQGIREVNFIHRDEGMQQMIESMGENPLDIVGYNFLPHALDVYLDANYVVPDSVRKINEELKTLSSVRDISYQEVVVEDIDRNLRIAGFILLGFSVLFLIISVTLIHNTIRLTLFSNRFLIKSMQLVGATQFFIRRPFIKKSVVHGITGAFLAIVYLAITFYLLLDFFPEYIVFGNYIYLAFIPVVMLLIGLFITAISSYFAVGKYLRMKLDELY